MENHGECGEAYSNSISKSRMHTFIKCQRPSIFIDFSSVWLSVQRISLPISDSMYSLLFRIMTRSWKVMSVIDRMTGSVSISMTYGVDVHPTNDQNLHIARLASAVISTCLTTGSSSVDLFPLLKHLPAWVPGTSFHATAKVARQHAKHLRERTYSEGRNKMVISLSRIYIP